MRIRIKPLLSFVWLSLLSATLLAQPAQTARQQRQVAGYVEQLQATLADVESDCEKNTARVQLAKLLWGQNEPQARQLLEEAFEGSLKIKAQQDSCAAQSGTALGLEILEFAATRDTTWSLQLIESLPVPQSPGAQAGNADLRLGLYQQLALRLYGATSEKAKEALAAVLNKLPKVESAVAEQVNETEPGFEMDTNGLAELSLFRAAAEPTANAQAVAAQALQRGDFKQVFNLLEQINDPQARLHFQAQ